MAFLVKLDYFGIADTAIVVKSSTEGASQSVAEAKGADGAIVATTIYGRTAAPSCDYALKGNVTKAEGDLALGEVKEVNEKSYALTNVTINTSAGGEPTISASGEQVEDNATAGCKFSLPAFNLLTRHHAQILMEAFTFTGTGCHLQSANYTASCNLAKGTKDGDCLAHDVIEGKIECAVEFVQTGADAPVVTPGEGWILTSPLTLTNSDSSYGTWGCTLTKYLAKE